jgi:hypothetical protein
MESSTTTPFGCLLANKMAECQPKKEPPEPFRGQNEEGGDPHPLGDPLSLLGGHGKGKMFSRRFRRPVECRFETDLAVP